MAAPAQQPEMADLSSAVLPGQCTPSTAREGEGASTSSEGCSTVQSALNQGTNGESKPATTDTADMHTLAPISHADGSVRGANNEVGGNTDKATVADSDHAYAIAKTEDTAAALPPQSENKPPSISKHAAPVTISTIGEVTESQEKGSQIVLELLLLSGSRKRFTFNSSTTVNEVLAWVFKDWPTEWEEQKPRELSQLRLLHRGQFLQGQTKLSSQQVEDSAVTVMHLNIRPVEGNESLKPKRTKTASNKASGTDTHSGGCCSGCIVS